MYDLVHLVHSKTKNEHSSIVVRMNVEKEVLQNFLGSKNYKLVFVSQCMIINIFFARNQHWRLITMIVILFPLNMEKQQSETRKNIDNNDKCSEEKRCLFYRTLFGRQCRLLIFFHVQQTSMQRMHRCLRHEQALNRFFQKVAVTLNA